MGMIMNRFNMLSQLRKDIKGAKDMGLDMKNFVLSGVVVHDTNDSELIERMSQNFVKWAEMTGHHFLFITFIHPSTDWKNSQYCHDGYWIDKDNLLTDFTYTKEDEERTVPLLRDFMNLPQNGSYLMLTDNLCSNSFKKIPISAQTIEEQFLLITKYCEDEYSGVEHTPADYDNLLATLNAEDYSLLSSFLDVLIDFTAVTSDLVDNGTEMKDEQQKRANEVINKLRKKLCVYRGDDFEDRLFHLFECMEMVFTKLMKDDKRFRFPPITNSICSNIQFERYLDKYSIKLIESFNIISSLTKPRAEDLDYSGLTIYLGKIVENELHLSLGQMLRWSMGIDMPTYYNKYCRRMNRVLVKSGKQTIDLNQSMSSSNCDNRQKGIPMGTLLTTYENMFYRPEEINPEPDFDKLQELDSKLFSFLRKFSSSYRNPAGHLDSNSKKTFEGAKIAFEDFTNNYLIQLYEIKQTVIEGD